ncbi:ABC1 kinase family protein [Anaeromassilibacillus sp. SJQ-5]
MKQPRETPPTANDAAPAGRPEETQNRLKEILQVLARHDIVKGMTPEKLRNIVEDLGPTFVKLGQIMSMRQDMLPAAYCRELSKLRTEVSPMPFDEVRQVIEEEYDTRLERVFASFDRQPLGAASIAQAHAAVLRDGSPVVVKVQRQGIRDVMARDIQLLRKAARILKATSSAGNALDFGVILNEMWAVAQQEMDFLIEARNAGEFYKLNQDVAYVTCPQIHSQVTTSRVLVMEYIEGFDLDRPDILTDNGYDLEEIGLKLADNYVKQIIDDGFFHADPHPGNLRIREGQIVFLDLGMMGRLSQRDKNLFRQAVRAIAEHNVNALKDVLLTLGVHNGRINHTRLYGDIEDLLTQYGSMGLADMDLGRMLEEFLGLANGHGISMPEGVTMLTRGMLTIQGVLASLAPELNLVQIMANRMLGEAARDFDLLAELKDGGKTLAASGRKAVALPAQLSDLLGMTIKGQTKVNLELTGSDEPLAQVDRMVNKLVLALLSAALLVGSSLICTTDMKPKLLGIPMLGAFGFFIALILMGYLLVDTFRKKRRKK